MVNYTNCVVKQKANIHNVYGQIIAINPTNHCSEQYTSVEHHPFTLLSMIYKHRNVLGVLKPYFNKYKYNAQGSYLKANYTHHIQLEIRLAEISSRIVYVYLKCKC